VLPSIVAKTEVVEAKPLTEITDIKVYKNNQKGNDKWVQLMDID
jgi:hypothetical protein